MLGTVQKRWDTNIFRKVDFVCGFSQHKTHFPKGDNIFKLVFNFMIM